MPWAVLFLAVLTACGDDSGSDSGLDGGLDAPVDSGIDAPGRDTGPDAGPPDPLSKGPWVLRAATDRATVVWETRTPPDSVSVTYLPEAGGATGSAVGAARETVITRDYGAGPPLVREPDLAGTYYVNEVAVTGLSPATCYRYTLDAFPERGGRFCTMHLSDDHTTPIRVYAIGDTNPVLRGTGRLLAATPPDRSELIVHLGDLQYYESVLETWQVWFGLMRPMLEAASFFPCVGNHEDELDGELTDFYQRLFTPASDDGDAVRYHFETGGVHFFSLDSQEGLTAGSEQLAWLDARLTEVEMSADYRFSILFMHRPIYCVGDYRPNLAAREALEPLITAHGIPLVLAGHMHGYERFEVGPVTHVTTGGGGGIIGNVDELVAELPEDAALRVASGDYIHVLTLTIEGDRITGLVTDDMGTVRDRFEKTVP